MPLCATLFSNSGWLEARRLLERDLYYTKQVAGRKILYPATCDMKTVLKNLI